MQSKFKADIEQLEKDIEYFRGIEFNDLANKFDRDLTIIKTLLEELTKKN